jgi:glycosidase
MERRTLGRLMRLRCCVFVLASLLSAWSAEHGAASASKITKVEPPNWWLGLPSPMIMLTGENLEQARVSTMAPGIRIFRTRHSRNGHYLFLWVEVGKQAVPGRVDFRVVTPGGTSVAAWKLERRDPAGQQPSANGGFNGFGPDDVIYLIMPDRFADGDPSNNFPASGTYDRSDPRAYHGGDLRGIQERLPYLKDLGVTTLWLTPISNNADHTGRDYHGYGAVDLYSVEEHFGTLAEYRALVSAAHQQGLKVILDVVPNHVGPENPWADDPPTDHWLHGTRKDHLTSNAEFQHLTDPYASSSEWRNIVEGWFAGVLPDMGTDDPMTAQFLRQNAIWWAETGAVDGFRLDTFPYVDRKFWHDFHSELHGLYPRFRTVGEVSAEDPAVASFFAGGKITAGIDSGVDTVFDFSFCSAVRRVVLQNAPTAQLEDVLRHDWLFPHPEWLVTFFGNHDNPRFMGEPAATPEKLNLAFSLLFTMRGIPQMYAGDEIGMPGGGDPDNRRDFPGGFPGDTRNAFTAEGRTEAERKVFDHVRGLLRLRGQHPALRRGNYVHIWNDERAFAYVRDFPGNQKAEKPERLLMLMNNSDQPHTVELPIADTLLANAKKLSPVMAEHDAMLSPADKITVELPARSLAIYAVE